MLCDEIKTAVARSHKVPVRNGYGPVYLLPAPRMDHLAASCWMIGDYVTLTKLATDLRDVPLAQDYIARFPVRFGLRETDRPPSAVRKVRIGNFQRGDGFDTDFSGERLVSLADPVQDGPERTNRRTDEEKNRRTYWQTQTPQSHHIVEYNHLRDLGVSQPDERGNGPMDHANLPCVLLAAEFHQKYITEILRPTRGKGKAALGESLWNDYGSLYERRGPLFLPLWKAAQVILTEAKKTAKGLRLVSGSPAR